MKRAVSILIQLLVILPGYGQYFHHIGIREGLSQLYVKSIYQDKHGRMWFGTNSGIDIYDGNSMYALDLADCISQNVELLYNKSSAGKIVGDEAGDVYFIVGGRFIQYRHATGKCRVCSDTPVSVVRSHDGAVYLWGREGLYAWNAEHDRLELINRITLDRVTDFVIGRDGTVWIATGHGLYRMDTLDTPPVLYAPLRSLNSLYETSRGDLWIASDKLGIFRKTANGKLVNYNKSNSSDIGLSCDFVRDIVEDRAGNLWFGTFDGLYKYDLGQNRFSVFKRGNTLGSLANSSIYSLYSDDQGYIWIGTYYGGVNYFDPDFGISYFPANQAQNGLSHPVIGNMVEDKRGIIWICTEGGGLNSFDPRTRQIRHFQNKGSSEYLPGTNLKAIAYDRTQDELYLATYPLGLYAYDIRNNRFRTIIREPGSQRGAPADLIHSLQIYDGLLYLGATNGVFSMDLSTSHIRPVIPNRYVAFSRIDQQGNIWTVDNKVIRKYPLQDPKNFQEYRLNITSNLLYLTTVYDDTEGRIYALTAGSGLFVLNEETNEFERFPKNNTSLASDHCYKLADTGHHLLVTGSKGLVVLDREGKITKIYSSNVEPFSAYVSDCGLFVSSDNLLYVGGTNGLVTLEPSSLDRYSHGKIYFSSLILDNEKMEPGDKHGILDKPLPEMERITLPYHARSLKIEFATNVFDDRYATCMYEYFLDGFDRQWNNISDNTIIYTNLSPGRYALTLRSKSEFQSESHRLDSAHLDIRILYPWYLRWWSLLLFSVVLLTGGVLLYRNRIRHKELEHSLEMEHLEKKHIQEVNEAKLQFFTNVSHEFRTPLTLIIGQIDILMQNTTLAPVVYNRILKIWNQVQRMNRLVSELLDFRKYESNNARITVAPESIRKLIAEITDSFKDMAAQKGVKYTVVLPEEDYTAWIDREQMSTVFINLISNSLKFVGNNGEVSIVVQDSDPEYVRVDVSDNGIGIKKEEQKRIFDCFYQSTLNPASASGTGIGLSLTQEIVRMHEGRIELESEEGKGSTFRVFLRKDNRCFQDNPHIVLKESAERRPAVSDVLLDKHPEHIDVVGEDLPAEHDGTKPTALLIDDNPALLDTLREIFSEMFAVEVATSGIEGLEKARELMPDIIISDVVMPDMLGTELCRKIKGSLTMSHIPVVLLTALTLPEHNIEGLRAGADDYVTKPFYPKLLLARCLNLIRTRRSYAHAFVKSPDMNIELLATTQLDKAFLENVTRIVDAHLEDPEFDVTVLVSELALSRSALFAKFKSLAGQTPNDFIIGRRLKAAAELLATNPGLSVSDIAYRYTFCTPGYFGKLFKAQFGVSPTEYREHQTKES